MNLSYLFLPMKAKNPNDRFIQPVPVPGQLRRDFAALCKKRGIGQAEVIRNLVGDWVKRNSVDGRKGKR